MLNAAHFGAKRKVKCCKMRSDKHKYSLKWYRQKLFKPLKTWPKRAKHPSKSGVLGAKSGEMGLKKFELATKLETLFGAKRRLYSRKQTKQKR